MYPDALPRMALTALLVAPPPPPQKDVRVKIVSEIESGLHAPARIPKEIKIINEQPAPYTGDGVQGMQPMDDGNGTVKNSLFSNLDSNTSIVPRVSQQAPAGQPLSYRAELPPL